MMATVPPYPASSPASGRAGIPGEIGPVKILLIEDDVETAGCVTKGLKEHGHVVDRAPDGREGLFLAAAETFDVVIVDRMLPKVDGLTIVRTIRASGSDVAILFLTTMSGLNDRVEGLEAGGDDHLVKPFAFSELLARVSALARRQTRSQGAAPVTLKVHDLEIDVIKRTVTRAGHLIDLQNQEFNRPAMSIA